METSLQGMEERLVTSLCSLVPSAATAADNISLPSLQPLPSTNQPLPHMPAPLMPLLPLLRKVHQFNPWGEGLPLCPLTSSTWSLPYNRSNSSVKCPSTPTKGLSPSCCTTFDMAVATATMALFSHTQHTISLPHTLTQTSSQPLRPRSARQATWLAPTRITLYLISAAPALGSSPIRMAAGASSTTFPLRTA